jgi:hypothetical protein
VTVAPSPHGRELHTGDEVRYGPCQQRWHHVEPVAAERADDLGPGVFDLAFQRQEALIGGGLGVGVGLQFLVAMEALRGLGELAELLVDHGLVVDGGRIGGALLFRVLELLERGVEVIFRVQKAAAGEEVGVLLLHLTLLLQLALKLQIELQGGDQRPLRAGGEELVVAVDLRLRLGEATRLRQQHRHVVEHLRLVGLKRVGFRELLIRVRVVLHLRELFPKVDRLGEVFADRHRRGLRRWHRHLLTERGDSDEKGGEDLHCRNVSMTVVSHNCCSSVGCVRASSA